MQARSVAKLLIVDDETAHLKALCEGLAPAGYAATCFASAKEALVRLSEQPFDLVLTNLVQPGMDEIAFLAAAREIDSDLVGIVMTRRAGIDKALEAMSGGALDYIVKPFKVSAVLPVLARALRVRQLRLENIHLQQALRIHELSMVIRLTLGFNDVLKKVADAAMGHAEISGVSVLLPIEDGKAFQVAAARGKNAKDKGKFIPFSPEISRWVEQIAVRPSAPTKLSDARSALPELSEIPGAAIPMLAGGRLIGILNLASRNPARPVSAAQVEALSILAAAAASALEAASLLDQVRSAERHYRSLAENAADMMFRYELEPLPRFAYVNPAAYSITGYSADEHYADPNLILKIVHPDDRHLMETVLRGGFSSGCTVTLRCVHRNGNTLWIEQRNTLVRDSDGRLIAIEGTGRDITERMHLEEQLSESQKMEALGLLAGGVAHDFNSLLTVIMGYSDLILVDDAPSVRNIERLAQVKKAAEQAATLVRQLLGFGRRRLVQPTVLDVNRVVRSNSQMLRRILGKDIELVSFLDTGLGLMKGDAGQIEQILMNLALNAKSAMPQGGKFTIRTENVTLHETPALEAMGGKRGPHLMLVVSDTGRGTDAATQARMSEPFFTAHRQGAGTGLGLSIVYEIVKQTAWHIRVFGEPEKGTRFEILLPRTEELEEIPNLAAIPLQTPIGSKTILIVVEDAEVRQLIATCLQRAGYEVLIALDGNEALRIYEQHESEVGLVLTDVIMRGMSGPTLVESLGYLNRGPRVLYMSGYADDALASPGHLDPRMPFIQKPFTLANLISRIREVMDGGIPA